MKKKLNSSFRNKIAVAVAILLSLNTGLRSQGPIAPTGLIGQKEIILIWDEGNDSASNVINHQVASLVTGYQGQPDLNKCFDLGDKVSENDGSYGKRQLDVAVGDFNGDGLSEYVVATLAPGNKIRLRIPGLSDSTLSYTTSSTLVVGTNVNHDGDIHVLTGNFDSDDADEFILAYKDVDHLLHIELYDTDNGLMPVFQAEVADETLANVLTANSKWVTLSITAGNFDQEDQDDLALAWGRSDSCGGIGCDDTFIYPLHIGEDLEMITFSYANRAETNLSANQLSPLNLKSGDLNADGRDEIVLGGSFSAEVLEADSTFTLVRKNRTGNYSDDPGYAVDFLRVANIDGQAGAEVIIFDHFFSNEPGGEQKFTFTVYGFNASLNRDSVLARRTNFEAISTGSGSRYKRHYGVAAGDFNGDNFRNPDG